MPGKPETDDWRVERGEQIQFQSSVCSQPWWRGVVEDAAKLSSPDQLHHGSVINGFAHSETNEEELVDGVDFDKQRRPTVSPSLSGTDKSGGDFTKENQNIKHAFSSTPFAVGKHFGPTSHQTELVVHSIYGGILTTYGQQNMINPQLYGMNHARMPLPLEMEEEPVYVNAKQYHGILRRRQSRAKAELERKVIRERKPYLHESRHLHAMRRARGNGGRFLNTKKLEGNNSNATPEKGNSKGTNPSTVSGSSHDTARIHANNDQYDASQFTVQDMRKVHSLAIGYRDSNGLFSLQHSLLNGRNEGDCFGGERQSMRTHVPPNGAIE